MNRSLRRDSFASLLAIAAGLWFVATALAQAPPAQESDLLDQTRRMERVATQKLESELRAALREAQRLASSNPAQAVEQLKKALALLESDDNLMPERRESLKRMLKDRIRVTESGPEEATTRVTQAGKKPAAAPDRAAAADAHAEIGRRLSTIGDLQKDGKTDDASREAGDLARRFPNSPAAQAAQRTTQSADQTLNARRLQLDRERSFAGASRDVEKSSSLPSGDVEYPKDWKDRTKGRTTAIQLSAKEKAILQSLNSTVTAQFKNSKFEDVIEYLQTVTGQPISVDHEALKEADITYDTPVTVNLKGVSLRSVLRKVLAELGMTYVIKEETILVTSSARAKEMMVVRRYYVGDLVASMSQLQVVGNLGGIRFSALANAQLALANQQVQAAESLKAVEQLKEMILTSVDPSTWQVNGGGGTIVFHPATMSFLIKQSAEVHAVLAGGVLK